MDYADGKAWFVFRRWLELKTAAEERNDAGWELSVRLVHTDLSGLEVHSRPQDNTPRHKKPEYFLDHPRPCVDWRLRRCKSAGPDHAESENSDRDALLHLARNYPKRSLLAEFWCVVTWSCTVRNVRFKAAFRSEQSGSAQSQDYERCFSTSDQIQLRSPKFDQDVLKSCAKSKAHSERNSEAASVYHKNQKVLEWWSLRKRV